MVTASRTAEIRRELIEEGFTLREETGTSYEYSSVNAEGEAKSIHVDKDDNTVSIADYDGAGRVINSKKYPLRCDTDLERIRTATFSTI